MAKTLKLSGNNFSQVLNKACEILKNGGVVIYPTETAYGMGCRISAESAVKRIYEIKKRDLEKALPVIVADREMIMKFAEIGKISEILMGKFMPRPLTLVVRKKEGAPGIVSKKNIAFRIPANEFARKLCMEVGEPLVSTSANVEGEREIYSAEEVIEKFGNLVDLIIDAGELEKRKVSTIFEVESRGVLRKGPVSEKEINEVLAEI